VGSQELVHFRDRACLWIEDDSLGPANTIPEVAERIESVRRFREDSSAKTTRGYAAIPHKFAQRAHKETYSVAVAKTSSEERAYLPADIFNPTTVISDNAFAIYGKQGRRLQLPSLRRFADPRQPRQANRLAIPGRKKVTGPFQRKRSKVSRSGSPPKYLFRASLKT